MTGSNQIEAKTPTAETQQHVVQASDTKAEAAGSVKVSEELSDEALDAVAGGVTVIAEQALLVAIGAGPGGGHLPSGVRLAGRGSQPQAALQTAVYNALVSEGLFRG